MFFFLFFKCFDFKLFFFHFHRWTPPPSAGPPKISRSFFPAPIYAFFLSLWGLLVEILVVFLKAGTLGLSCESPGGPWTLSTACACAERPPVGTFQGSVGRMATSFSSSHRRSRWWLRTRCCQTPLSLRKRLRRVRWLVRTLWQQKVKRDPVVVSLRIWETRGGTVVQNNPDRDSDVESWTESDGGGWFVHSAVEASDSFFCETIWASCLQPLWSSDTNSTLHIASHLASERTIVGFPLSSRRAAVAPDQLQSETQSHLLDDQHSELYGEREHLLKPTSLRHRANCFENSNNSSSAMAGSDHSRHTWKPHGD